ncbi:MAG: hypothetical protein A2W98_12445 [Bacteroidetes bacterium GWF2_33_38]|nr:MAG: hypothetical protein A2W98_12445 [Bacteroidetes bacterium GWF2_33_38]OFY71805.1 MAG: hypothetical protein A2265_01210 [Bacteroidetes bacterium RIFOXYA12_FULL_33_9]OFY87482.1 MAG: hypothetical protein A2236_00180 [Bacteroidetes bacterium RIFOXYA2_FULL_33_7]
MKITISKREFNQFYVYNYYFGQRAIINNMRRLMGPTLAGVGLYLYLFTSIKESSALGFWSIVFILAYGLFYTVKPLIFVLALASTDETFEFEIEDDNLYIKDRLREDNINLIENKLEENKKYFFVKLKNNQIIFFPKEMLDKKTYSLFEKRIR